MSLVWHQCTITTQTTPPRQYTSKAMRRSSPSPVPSPMLQISTPSTVSSGISPIPLSIAAAGFQKLSSFPYYDATLASAFHIMPSAYSIKCTLNFAAVPAFGHSIPLSMLLSPCLFSPLPSHSIPAYRPLFLFFLTSSHLIFF